MRTLALALTFVLSTLPAAFADEPSPLDLPTDVQRSRDRWLQCTAAAAKGQIHSSRPAATVAILALQRCKVLEEALARALNRQLGASGAARVIEITREADRANLTRVIEELRVSR